MILTLFAAAVGFVLIWALFNKIFYHPITPAEPQAVFNELSAKGFETQFVTEQVSEEWKKIGLTECVAAQKGGTYIIFYSFDNDEASRILYNKAVSLIHKERRDPPTRDYSEGNSNHWRYTLFGGDMYSTAIYVGSTAIYAYGDAESEAEINGFLQAIGYIN